MGLQFHRQNTPYLLISVGETSISPLFFRGNFRILWYGFGRIRSINITIMQGKYICALMAFFSFFSCQKENELVRFKIDYSLTEQNSMYTKAIPSEQVTDAIEQSLPSSVSLVLKDANGGVKVVTSGQETALPPGTYSVTGSSYGGQVGEAINTNCYFTNQPYITISDQITISQGVSDYVVNGTYKSFAIAVDYDEISSATYEHPNGNANVPFQRFDNLGLVFAQGDYSSVPLKITLIPKGNDYQETTFGFSTNSTTQKYTYVEVGKYYKLHPAPKGSSGPVVGVGFPGFVEGNVK